MPILSDDIKLYESDTMNDVPEGGGAITGDIIVAGQSNNIFDDISTLDRVYGAVHMRKIYGKIHTQSTDKGYGAHMIISKIPSDDKLSVNLFNTNDWFDRRPEAATRVENYLAKGGKYNGFLWATQFQGSKAVTIFQNENNDIPGVGDVLVLTSDTDEQFVRIVNITDQVQQFTDTVGSYTRRILTIEISDALTADFIGSEVSRYDSLNPDAVIFNTIVANAAKYYSSRPVTVAPVLNDVNIEVDSVFSQIVPSAQSEIAILDVTLSTSFTHVTSARDNQSETGYNSSLFGITDSNLPIDIVAETHPSPPYLDQGHRYYLPCSPEPGSIVTSSRQLSGGVSYNNTSNLNSTDRDVYINNVPYGQLINQSGNRIHEIDYKTGQVTVVSTTNFSTIGTIFFKPGAFPDNVKQSISLPVTIGNRGFVWVANLPNVAPATTRVSYMVQGKWYDLDDDGNGNISGSETELGQGTINFQTGSVNITLGFLPDIDSDIIISYGVPTQYRNVSDQLAYQPQVRHTITNQGVQPDSLVITWNDGVARTASSDINGDITGDGVGTFDIRTGEVRLTPNILPNVGTTFNFDYDFGTPTTSSTSTIGTSGTVATVDLGSTNIIPKSVKLDWIANFNTSGTGIADHRFINAGVNDSNTVSVIIIDDGVGGFTDLLGNSIAGATINYATGIASFETALPVTLYYYNEVRIENTFRKSDGSAQTNFMYRTDGNNIQTVTVPSSIPTSLNISLRTTAANSAPTEQLVVNELKGDVTGESHETIVPNTLVATFADKLWTDRNGQLVIDHNATNGSATQAGTLNHDTGEITLTNWIGGASNTGILKALLTNVNRTPVPRVSFRIPSAPVKPESFTMRYISSGIAGEQTATADSAGAITGNGATGFINYETGVVDVVFGNRILAAGNESEPWYNAADVDLEGFIIQPVHAYADSIKYNAVGISRVPLSADILGLDPVRLPVDGRVPIYVPGDVVVLLNDQTTSGTYSNNELVNLNRVRLAKVQVRDSAGQDVPLVAYTPDLDAGTVQFGDLTGISQPITIIDRIEDMSVVSDVSVTGVITLSQPISHDYPLNDTLLANAVIFGDLFARTSIPFDQQTWTGVWDDSLIGNNVLAQYNNSQYPIVVDNASTITERWAMIFTSSTNFNIVGEGVGVIGTGNINSITAPINPNTSQPYFSIPQEGWGSGWSSGNVLRFNTFGAGAPTWIIQAVSQGDASDPDYQFCVEMRLDVDAP